MSASRIEVRVEPPWVVTEMIGDNGPVATSRGTSGEARGIAAGLLKAADMLDELLDDQEKKS